MIAISYRREDSLPITGRVYDHLEARFGKRNVFMDFASIRPGLDFRQQIKQTIERSEIVVAMIGPNWMGQGKGGVRRIDDPEDFVRLEIEYALKRGIPIIPVLINNTPMPEAENLPSEIQPLTFLHALPLDGGLDFRQHAKRLIAAICNSIGVTSEKKRMAIPSTRSTKKSAVVAKQKRLRWLALAASLVLFATVVATFVRLSHHATESSSAIVEKSIAVLPFENRSEDKANAYFADGIQDEILTRLSKIADLKVISRTSTQHYQNKPRNLAQIAKQLGVATILEGSVQKAADQVRVNVQLINAQTDSHLWADTYDRKMTDIFGVESEIAKRIAAALQAKLTGLEEQALAAKPTNNPEAYDAYLRGLAFQARFFSSFNSRDLGRKAISFFERAVQLDPNFVPAWARLSRADALLYFGRTDTADAARGDAAKGALESAQKLEANSPETLLALGYYQFCVLQDYALAKTTFSRVSKVFPGSSEVPYALARVSLYEGHFDQSIGYFEQALALDPRNVELLNDAAWTHAMRRQLPAALKLYDRVLDITPNDPNMMAAKAGIYQAEGNLQEAARSLPDINWPFFPWHTFVTKMTQLRLERNYGELIRVLQTRLAQFHFDLELDRAINQAVLALTQHLAADTAGAKFNGEQARKTLERFYRDQLDSILVTKTLSQAYAAMGEKDSALKAAERAVMLVPRAKDPQGVPILEENVAVIQTIFGENSRAISILTRLLQTPYDSPMYPFALTPALLRLDPIWDPLRADPAFQKPCEEKQP